MEIAAAVKYRLVPLNLERFFAIKWAAFTYFNEVSNKNTLNIINEYG